MPSCSAVATSAGRLGDISAEDHTRQSTSSRVVTLRQGDNPHARATVLTAAYAVHPERFVRHHPQPPPLPIAAWINAPLAKLEQDSVSRQTHAAVRPSEPRQWRDVTSNTSAVGLADISTALTTQEGCLLAN